MDQFDQINSKNKKIIKIIIALASFFVISIILPLSFFIYANVALNNITADVDYELMENGEISKNKGVEYAGKLENIPLKFIFKDQYYYNYYLAEAYGASGEYDKMVFSAQKMIESGDEHPVSHYYLGWAYYKGGNYNNAEKELEKAISMMDDLSAEEDYVSYELDTLFLEEEIEIYKALADVNVKKENSNRAKTYLALAIDLRMYSLSEEYINNFNENLYYNYYGDYDFMPKIDEMPLDEKSEAIVIEFADKIVKEHSGYFDNIQIKKIKNSNYLSDGDNDGLSDNLEKVLGTSEYKKDTDKDGFDDKKELIGGYDPLVKSPLGVMDALDYYNLYLKIIDL
ncbi:hypothetical protein KAK05_00700 [Candidatus Parcubacteria bacterium]|nr:hypothetical protein [Candidatus Parcubacteria bacterium]